MTAGQNAPERMIGMKRFLCLLTAAVLCFAAVSVRAFFSAPAAGAEGTDEPQETDKPQETDEPQETDGPDTVTITFKTTKWKYICSESLVLDFAWTTKPESAYTYTVKILRGTDTVDTQNVNSASCRINAGTYSGTYQLKVTAILQGTAVASAAHDFTVSSEQEEEEPQQTDEPENPDDPEKPDEPEKPEKPEKRRGIPHFRGRGRRGGSDSGNDNGISPGVALTTSHARGSMNTDLYGAATIGDEYGTVTVLRLTDGCDSILLDGEDLPFDFAVDGDLLLLDAGNTDVPWIVRMDALKALNLAGITAVEFENAGKKQTIATAFEPSGRIWGVIRSRGFVSSDCKMIFSGGECLIVVDEQTYKVDENGKLTEAEG